MRLVKIGVSAVSVKVGDFSGNASALRAVVEEARGEGVHLLVTPELGLSGYSLSDRVWWPDIARRSWETLEEFAGVCRGISVFVGLPIRMEGLAYNALALVHDGEIAGLILKKYLPTYSIFYEGRNWTSWAEGVTEHQGVPAGDLVFDLPFGKVSAEICEDLWATRSPAQVRARAGAEILCNASGSPFTPRKNEQRKRLVERAAGNLLCVYAFSNVLGLDDSRLVFDGGGIIATPDGIVAEGPILSKAPWTLTTAVVDLEEIVRERAENSTWRQAEPNGSSYEDWVEVYRIDGTYEASPVAEYAAGLPESLFLSPAPGMEDSRDEISRYLDELFDAMVLGLRDYFEKVGVFERFLIALSGGRDSALCLVLAVAASKEVRVGADAENFADRVSAVYLPNAGYSSDATRDAAESLAREMGVGMRVVSIAEEAKVALAKAGEMLGGAEHVSDLTKQNLQARVRGNMMLNWANSAKGLLLVTSNLSESAVGYTTTGGDNQGGYSPIANLPKTLVSRLLKHVAERDGISSLQKVLDIPPSAELAAGQQDEEDLMPYAVLDDLLYLFARQRRSLSDCWRIVCHRHDAIDEEQLREWTAEFGRLFVYSQWKREQLPVSLKVLELDLDPKTGFRFPVTQSIEDELDELRDAAL